ncbi:hypothetical protein BDZ97DRAFT_1913942 [Flammula alnicola]|nr:hypothetical protein BDZ97DRAFT_1913942 [Flammula alnicola]
MAIINISSVIECGKPKVFCAKLVVWGRRKSTTHRIAAAMCVMAKKAAAAVPGSSTTLAGVDAEKMDADKEHKADAAMKSPTAESQDNEDSNLAAERTSTPKFTFAMLSHILRRPSRKSSQYAHSNLNP